MTYIAETRNIWDEDRVAEEFHSPIDAWAWIQTRVEEQSERGVISERGEMFDKGYIAAMIDTEQHSGKVVCLTAMDVSVRWVKREEA